VAFLTKEERVAQEQIRIINVTEGLKSLQTKQTYRLAFERFLKVTVKNDDLRALLDTKKIRTMTLKSSNSNNNNNKVTQRKQKQDKAITLVDIGRRNTMSVNRIRTFYIDENNNRIEYFGDVPPNEAIESEDSVEVVDREEIPFIGFIPDDRNKGNTYPEPYQLPEIESGYEEGLEAGGATVIVSSTYYPASGVTISKRSMTHDETADERGFLFR
jgi:hypothetical protein